MYPQFLSQAGSHTENLIVGCQEDISVTFLRTGQVKRVQRLKAVFMEFFCPLPHRIIHRNSSMDARDCCKGPSSPSLIRSLFDFIIQDFASDPLPLTCFTMAQNQQYGLRFKPNAILAVIVKWPIYAACIEIDSHCLYDLITQEPYTSGRRMQESFGRSNATSKLSHLARQHGRLKRSGAPARRQQRSAPPKRNDAMPFPLPTLPSSSSAALERSGRTTRDRNGTGEVVP